MKLKLESGQAGSNRPNGTERGKEGLIRTKNGQKGQNEAIGAKRGHTGQTGPNGAKGGQTGLIFCMQEYFYKMKISCLALRPSGKNWPSYGDKGPFIYDVRIF